MRDYNKTIISVLQMILGTALTAASFGLIIIPQGFAAAGVTGFSKIITHIIPVNLSVMVFVVNMFLLLLGLICVGRRFAVKTVAVSVLFPLMLEVFSKYPIEYFNGRTVPAILIAGVILGLGAGLVLKSGASTGGFDVLAVILNKKFGISIATVLNICDVIVILMQAVGTPVLNTVYGIIVITLSARVVNLIVNSEKAAYKPALNRLIKKEA